MTEHTYHTVVTDNQSAWRRMHSIFWIRPEARRASNMLDERIKRVFGNYIDPAFPRPFIGPTLSHTDKASKLPHHFLPFDIPDDVPEDKKESYAIGIRDLNEWATDFATDYFFSHVGKRKISRAIGREFGFFTNDSLSHITRYMFTVAKYSGASPEEFDDAVLSSIFKHDFEGLNKIIDAGHPFAKNVTELAIKLGETGQSQYIEGERNRNDASFLRRMWHYAGYNIAPGIIELGIARPFSIPRTAVHESIHYYAGSEHYQGLLKKGYTGK